MGFSKDTQRVEAALLLEQGPLLLSKLKRLCGLKSDEVRGCLEQIESSYRASGSVLGVEKRESGYQLGLRSDFQDPLLESYSVKKRNFSASVLETLAIIAYRQPATKGEIEHLRGVSSHLPLKLLLEESFVRVDGKKDLPGKPFLYVTTGKFLEYFEIRSLDDLPVLKDIKTYDFLEES